LTDGLGNDSTLSLSTTAASIAGTLAVSGDVSIADKIVHIGDTNTAIRFPAADTITFETSGAEAARITSAGNVGIGTSSPASKLDVNGNLTVNNVLAGSTSLFLNSADTGSTTLNFGGTSAPTKGRITYSDFSDVLIFSTNSTERVRVTNDGLTFNGDTAAANALDDYEEGTWTMGVSFDGASVGVTYTLNTGSYTKIGRQVTVTGYLILSSKGSSTGNARITGLPFTIQNSNGNYSPPSFLFNGITFANQFQGFGDINTTNIALDEITALGTTSSITDADFSNSSQIMVSLTYFA
jgi:hypothetical protein